jgi:hypothetical protein
LKLIFSSFLINIAITIHPKIYLSMNAFLEKINLAIEPYRHQIINHKVYANICEIEDLQIFMKYHVYAVWDFMSLLKALQNELTCTTIPWYPKGSAQTRFLINEIVIGEESDVDMNGERKSHFELYLEAMQQAGSETESINIFIDNLLKTNDLQQSFEAAETPLNAIKFVNFTFDIIKSQKPYLQAAIFTFGREDLIPNMFMSIINDMDKSSPYDVSIFKYYLERHIEVDGDHHSHLALEMTENLCQNNEIYWKEALEAVVESLKKRIELWDGAFEEIMQRKEVLA